MLYEKWRQKSENFQLEKGLYLASYKKILKKARITTRTFNVKNFILISNEGAWREKKSQSCPFFWFYYYRTNSTENLYFWAN